MLPLAWPQQVDDDKCNEQVEEHLDDTEEWVDHSDFDDEDL